MATVVLGSSLSGSASVIHVPADQPTIQAGIAAAARGDTVIVACGYYVEHDIIMKSGITLTSETGLADCVVIDGEAAGRIFYCEDVDSSTQIIGFSVTEGFTWDTGTWPDGYGGGIYCERSSPEIVNVLFHDGFAEQSGGGLMCYDASCPRLRDCTFYYNRTQVRNGAGIYCDGASCPVLEGVTFLNNSAGGAGGAIGCYSDGSCRLNLLGCTFTNNSASLGGAIGFVGNDLTATGCVFTGNTAGVSGGAVYIMWSSPLLTDCTFLENTADSGGAIYCDCSDATFSGCTFAGNSNHIYHGYYFDETTFTNCILAFSPATSAMECELFAVPVVTHCSVFGNAGGDSLCGEYSNNMFVDPLFCEPPTADVSLCSDSSCLPNGNPWGELVGAHGSGCGPCGSSAVMETSWGNLKALYR